MLRSRVVGNGVGFGGQGILGLLKKLVKQGRVRQLQQCCQDEQTSDIVYYMLLQGGSCASAQSAASWEVTFLVCIVRQACRVANSLS